jgi:hypothetical protein
MRKIDFGVIIAKRIGVGVFFFVLDALIVSKAPMFFTLGADHGVMPPAIGFEMHGLGLDSIGLGSPPLVKVLRFSPHVPNHSEPGIESFGDMDLAIFLVNFKIKGKFTRHFYQI